MKTAVEWLFEQIVNRTDRMYFLKEFEQAKEMEKEQLKQLMWDLTEIDTTKTNKGLIIDNRFETYWNETFKSE
jgi:hypothetical protein